MIVRARLYRRKSIWYIRYQNGGKYSWRSTGTSDRKIAEALKTDLENRLMRSQITGQPLAESESASISDIIRRYLKHSEVTNSKTTWEGECYHLRPLLNFLARKGVRRLEQLNADIMQQYQVESLQQNSIRTFNNQLSAFKTALNKAVEWGVISSNPIAKVKKIKVAVRYHYFKPIEIDQQLKNATPYLLRLIGFGVYAGLRRAEMAELKMTDIDFKKKEIKIRSEKDYTPKGKRPRTVPLSDKLAEILNSTDCLKGAWVLPRTMKDGAKFNFHRLQELSLTYQRFLKKLNQIGKLHDLRHTFGTYAVASGVPLRDVQAWMGHSDVQSTLIYAHHAPDFNREKINLLPY
jgi:integrase